jgi:hypothetical protein
MNKSKAVTSVLVITLAACARADHPARAAATGHTTAKFCPPAPGGIIVSVDKMAYFPSRAPIAELERLCPAAGDTLYDAVGWQASATKFPFVGAMLVAIHSGSQPDVIPSDEPDMWTASGDSVRLPDGQLIPRTLRALRTLGPLTVDDNDASGDDWNGPDARGCRFPDILFKLDGTNLPKQLPDSARVISVEIDVRHPDAYRKFCAKK